MSIGKEIGGMFETWLIQRRAEGAEKQPNPKHLEYPHYLWRSAIHFKYRIHENILH